MAGTRIDTTLGTVRVSVSLDKDTSTNRYTITIVSPDSRVKDTILPDFTGGLDEAVRLARIVVANQLREQAEKTLAASADVISGLGEPELTDIYLKVDPDRIRDIMLDKRFY